MSSVDENTGLVLLKGHFVICSRSLHYRLSDDRAGLKLCCGLY